MESIMDGLEAAAKRIIDAALKAADPFSAVEKSLGFSGRKIALAGREFEIRGRVFLIAVGKAALGMARAALGILDGAGAAGPALAGGIVLVPHGYARELAGNRAGLRVLSSAHPVPDEAGAAAARSILGAVDGLGPEDLCLVLISGGGSSLMSLPAEGLGLGDIQAVNEVLLASGADIAEINVIRKHLSSISGGRLAARAACPVATLAVSDVRGDDLSLIASGPTTADPSSFADALGIVERYGIRTRFPPSALAYLREGAAGRNPESPKALDGAHYAAVISSNGIALDAACEEARRSGFPPLVLSRVLSGEARDAGKALALEAIAVSESRGPAAPPACIIAGGETTVTVRGSGRGGRNHEIALAAAIQMEGRGNILFASFATDGVDGKSGAAGARASGLTLEAGRKAGMDALASLENNDSGSYFSAIGESIVTGPTGTNVNDISFALVSRP
jgi:glycerate 2-kinase